MNAKELLLSQEALVDLILNHGYIPQKRADGYTAIITALHQLEPTVNYAGCAGCMIEAAHKAKFYIDLFKRELQFRTFPKQEPPVYNIIDCEITGISITSDSPMPDFVVTNKPEQVKKKPGRPKSK